MEDKIFGERLTQARERKGLSMRALSQEAGVSPQSMSQYAKGETMPPLRSAIKIAEALGVSLDWLCGMDDKENKRTITTYGEVAALLLKLMYTDGLETEIETEDEDGYDMSTYRPTRVSLNIYGTESLFDFFYRLEKYASIAQGDDDERRLIREWIDSRLAKMLDERIVPVETDELPF